MGYTTEFEGEFKLNKVMEEDHANYINKFCETRRMKRNPNLAKDLADPLREKVGLDIGEEGAYFVGGLGDFGQTHDKSVIDGNSPPIGQPGLWCQWIVSEDRKSILWDGGEKFYKYVQWLEYIVKHFLAPWGYSLNGSVWWHGEDPSDIGLIEVKDNIVQVKIRVR